MKTHTYLAGLASLIAAVRSQTIVYQAEDAELTGTTVGKTVAGFTGTGYVEGFDADGDKITFTVPGEGILYDLDLVYSSPNGDKQTYVVLNGAGGSQVQFYSTTGWTTVSAGQVLLNKGNNTIEIRNSWGWYFIDSIKVTPSKPRGPHKHTSVPVNPNANVDAKALLKYLGSVYGKNILSGQQETADLKWIEQNVGKTPAILGLDLMDYTDSRKSRGASSTHVDDAIAFSKRGGIVTFCWHWGAPVGLYDTAENPWYRGFYTTATDFNVTRALADTTNANYTLLVKDIDTIAIELKKLSDAGVPVIWRPLHEAEGGWFWWGAQGPESAKKLWGIVYERLTNYHKINNLIWMWNSVASTWYPGDATVDMLSADTYAQGDHGPISSTYNTLLALGKDTKIIAASELGSVPDPAQLKLYQADWVYFVTWSGEYISGGVWNTLEFLKKVYNDPYVLNLDAIQGWRNGGSNPPPTTLSTVVPKTSTTSTAKTSATSTAKTSSAITTKPTSSTITSKPVSTTPTSTKAAPTTSQPAGTVPKWGQCGGINYTGPTACVAGSTCQKQNDWFYQCL